MPPKTLPVEFLRALAALERAYLAESDPLRQSGFGGVPHRWRAEREPILHAIDGDGDLLDIGCANGMLLESFSAWALERHITLTPYGVDQGAQLIALARARYPGFASHFFVGNAWSWQPPRCFRYVYTLYRESLTADGSFSDWSLSGNTRLYRCWNDRGWAPTDHRICVD